MLQVSLSHFRHRERQNELVRGRRGLAVVLGSIQWALGQTGPILNIKWRFFLLCTSSFKDWNLFELCYLFIYWQPFLQQESLSDAALTSHGAPSICLLDNKEEKSYDWSFPQSIPHIKIDLRRCLLDVTVRFFWARTGSVNKPKRRAALEGSLSSVEMRSNKAGRRYSLLASYWNARVKRG